MKPYTTNTLYFPHQIKKIFFILFLLLQNATFANMASPMVEGTLGTFPFINQFVDVTREDLHIKIDSNFKYANIHVKYYINTLKDSVQIPFLFYDSEYLNDFTVTIDGKKVEIKKIPNQFKTVKDTKFKDFAQFFEKNNDYNNKETAKIEMPAYRDFYITLDNMLYFETDISKGEHLIEVTYRARRWIDKSGWVKKYSFRYALSPAKYWKSFGTLNVKIDATEFKEEITTNLGKPHKEDINNIAQWKSNELPVDVIHITYEPEISGTAKFFSRLGPIILTGITGIILILLHWIMIFRYRKKHPEKKYSTPVIAGSILIPLLIIIIWGLYYFLIDALIGEHAGNASGGVAMVILTLFYIYPFFTPVYWLVNWLIDKYFKKKLS